MDPSIISLNPTHHPRSGVNPTAIYDQGDAPGESGTGPNPWAVSAVTRAVTQAPRTEGPRAWFEPLPAAILKFFITLDEGSRVFILHQALLQSSSQS